MQVKRFNLSTSELKRIKTDLNEKKRSSFILQPQHIHLKGKHELYLDDENSEKIAVLLAQKKSVPNTLHTEIYKGGSIGTKKNITGGVIPLVFAGIGAVSGIIGAISAAVSAVKDWKHKNAEEAETHRHNLTMEKLAKKAKTVTIGRSITSCKTKKKSLR